MVGQEKTAVLIRFLLCLYLLLPGAARADLPKDGFIGATPLRYSVVLPAEHFEARPALAALGKKAFFDPSLSEPGGLSCSSCHDPAHAYAGNRGSTLGVAPGSRKGRFGLRNTPSLMYVRYVPALYLYQDDDDKPAPEPRGGLFADGRVDSLDALPAGPLLNPLEMGNRDAAMVARKLEKAGYAVEFKKTFGADVFADPKHAMSALGQAIQAFLQSDELAPFSSRYDDFIRGRGQLSAQELRGLTLFRDQTRGNCGTCHVFNETSNSPLRSPFTDYGYDALAAPRNAKLPANRDPKYFDLGLCTTAGARHWPDPDNYCGYFRTPGLRNVAVRKSYMHNGAFKDLREVVSFYATRSTNPKKWYGSGPRFNDLPEMFRGNVNINSVPYNRREGVKPALDDADVDAIVAFVRTLTDAPWRKDEVSR